MPRRSPRLCARLDISVPCQFLRSERRAWLVLVLLFLVSIPAVTPRIYASDEIEYFAYLRSLWFDRDVSFENEYRYFYDRGVARAQGFHETFLERRSATGLRENFGTLGSALLWSPFYAVGDIVARAARQRGQMVDVDGFSRPYVAAVCYGSAVYGFLALLVAASTARRLMGRPGSAWPPAAAASLVWLGTPLLFYMYVAPPYSHACSAFAVALFVGVWLRVRERWSVGGLALLGALASLMTMVREQDALMVVGPALDFAWAGIDRVRQPSAASRGDSRASARRAVAHLAAWFARAVPGVITAALVFTPQALAYLALNGRIGPSHTVSAKMAWWAPHGLQVILSPEHGFFVWTPIAMVAVAGLVLLVRSGGRHARLAWCLLAMVASQVYIAGSVRTWTVAGAFGQRRFIGLTVVLVIGLAVVLRHATSRRRAVMTGAILAVCTWWNVALLVQFGTGLMDRQRLEPGRNLYQAFVGVPRRLPEIAWRYLFDRASFYRPADGGER